jgi:cytidylate kinase
LLFWADRSRSTTCCMTTPDAEQKTGPLIGIVGPCGAGKSTLAAGLQRHGFRAHAVTQEHSYVKDMWQQLTRPDVLIFLQASHSVGARRRNMNWTEAEWHEQQLRLLHAREHADLFINTDPMTIEQVLTEALGFLKTTA